MSIVSVLYKDNIPSVVVSDKSGSFPRTMGYYLSDDLRAGWVYAPDENGNVPKENGNRIKFGWGEAPLTRVGTFRTVKSGESYLDSYHYAGCEDRNARKYTLVPANDGYVPVRHGTDPILNNWISRDSNIKIIYDNNKVRHPGVKSINYREHGFTSKDDKSWFPIKSADKSPTKFRIQEPYFRDYEQLFPQKPTFYDSLSKVATAGAAVFGALQPNPIPTAFALAATACQATRPLADAEAKEFEATITHREARYRCQSNILKLLEREDENEHKGE